MNDDQFVNLEINVMLEMLLREDHASIMKLRSPIPPPQVYPWETFLRLNFSPDLPHVRPYTFKEDDFARDDGRLRESARPRSYYALFRFMEFYRRNLDYLEQGVEVVEDKFRYFKFKNKQSLDVRQVDRGQLNKNVQNALIQAYNIVSHRGHLETLYKIACAKINQEIQQRGEFNLRKQYGSQTMESDLYPDYGVLTRKLALMLHTVNRIRAILDGWRNIRNPSGRPDPVPPDAAHRTAPEDLSAAEDAPAQG